MSRARPRPSPQPSPRGRGSQISPSCQNPLTHPIGPSGFVGCWGPFPNGSLVAKLEFTDAALRPISVRNRHGWPDMTDFLTWSFNLGRWAGVQVRVHYLLVIFAVGKLFHAATTGDHRVGPTACWLLVLLLVLALHELGHAVMALARNVEPDDVRLWLLGNFVVPSGSNRSTDNLPVALAGLMTSGFLAMTSAIVLAFFGDRMVVSPFGYGDDAGAAFSNLLAADGSPGRLLAYHPLWFVGWFGYLNMVVFLANLIPALPFDGGRVLRVVLARSGVGITRDNPYPQWTARGFALILALVGLIRFFMGLFNDGLTLITLAILIELVVRSETRMMEDGGFFDDGVFGYDFSEGYTSLESSAAKVRPYRESALKRWRRRRSELRRRRRLAREAAEDRRMDEILEKLHLQGKASLTDEENRFLVRVSTKLRNRPRARD
jgi:stage IV sporulation protein FB